MVPVQRGLVKSDRGQDKETGPLRQAFVRLSGVSMISYSANFVYFYTRLKWIMVHYSGGLQSTFLMRKGMLPFNIFGSPL